VKKVISALSPKLLIKEGGAFLVILFVFVPWWPNDIKQANFALLKFEWREKFYDR
jgi:hypothetical protein